MRKIAMGEEFNMRESAMGREFTIRRSIGVRVHHKKKTDGAKSP